MKKNSENVRSTYFYPDTMINYQTDIKEVAQKPRYMKNESVSIGENELEELDWGKTSNLCVAWKATVGRKQIFFVQLKNV